MKHLWAYAYQVVPRLAARRLGGIRALLSAAAAAPPGRGRFWAGRLVLEPAATSVLIVSDSPNRDHPLDQRLAAELQRLGAPFTITAPLAVTDPIAATAGVATSGGNGRGASPLPPAR